MAQEAPSGATFYDISWVVVELYLTPLMRQTGPANSKTRSGRKILLHVFNGVISSFKCI